MRHPTIGRKVHLVFEVEPTFIDLNLHAGGDTELPQFMKWLDWRDLCKHTIAFHHLVTNKRSDSTSGIAYVGTVCHSGCWNTAITEIGWGSPAAVASTMAHEFGHNLGALHTFDEENEGRGCHGIMSYGQHPDTWSECSRDSWLADYELFLKATDRSRADQCFRPTK